MAAYTQIKQAITDEKELIGLMQQLPEQEFQQLMTASETFARVKEAQARAKEEEEKSKQAEIEKEINLKNAEEETKRHKMTLEEQREQIKLRTEEGKKLEEHRTKQEEQRLETRIKREREAQNELTKAKLEAKRQFLQLEKEKIEKEEERIKLQHDLEQQELQKEMERQRRLIEHKMKVKASLEQELADFRYEQRLRDHKTFWKDNLERDVALQTVLKDTEIEKEQVRMDTFLNFFSGKEGRDRLFNIAAIFVGVATAIYALRVVTPLAQKGLTNFFFRPKLISRSEKFSFWNRIFPKPPPKVILPAKLEERMNRVIEGTKRTAERGGIFSHTLLHGKPGTGKTLVAEKLARLSHMDFAVMSGPAFDQFEPKDAIQEIRNLFKWANRSKRGLLLFIDECDSFLEDRATLSPERVRVLNEFINQTGTEGRKFMLVFETNRPDVLDAAVQSRVTQSIEFEAPGPTEVEQMFRHYTDKYIINEHKKDLPWFRRIFSSSKKIDTSALNDNVYKTAAQKMATHEFVGRDVTNTVIAITQATYASKGFAVTPDIVDRVVDEQIKKKETERKFKEITANRRTKGLSGGVHI